MKYSKKHFEEHLANEHSISPFAAYLKEIVYGGNDGIVTTFAVVAGFAGATGDTNQLHIPILVVFLFGFANLIADGAAMGLGNFLAVRSDQDVYRQERAKEEYEVEHSRKMEIVETQYLLESKGFTKDQAKTITEIYATNPEYWVDFMMQHELELPDPTGDNAALMGLFTFGSFIIFGAIPLLPYLVVSEPQMAFLSAIGSTAVALGLLGTLRWKLSKASFLSTFSETVLVGAVAASLAYVVGIFFRV